MWKAGIGMVALLLVLSAAMAYGANISERSVWDRVSLEKGNATFMGGGKYIALRCNGTFVGVVYGSAEHPNSVKIFARTVRYAGGVKIYDSSGNLKRQMVLKYNSLIGQSFNYIWEFRDTNNNDSFDAQIKNMNGTLGAYRDNVIKGVSLYGEWNLSGIEITNITSNETRIDFTIYRDNIPYTWVYNSSVMGDNVVNRIAFHFHITVSIVHREVRGFPWYSYRQGDGFNLEERKNYTGDIVVFKIKYDKDIEGWDYEPNSKLAVGNNIFFGISGNEKIVHMIIKRYGGCRARIDNHTYDNSTLPHRRIFRHPHRVIFTELGEWHRIGRFVWESNVTVDGSNRTAYFEINGGERIYRWFRHHAFALVVLHGMLIYPAGENVYQDPALEVEQINLDLTAKILPTGFIAVIGLVSLIVAVAGISVYITKKQRH